MEPTTIAAGVAALTTAAGIAAGHIAKEATKVAANKISSSVSEKKRFVLEKGKSLSETVVQKGTVLNQTAFGKGKVVSDYVKEKGTVLNGVVTGNRKYLVKEATEGLNRIDSLYSQIQSQLSLSKNHEVTQKIRALKREFRGMEPELQSNHTIMVLLDDTNFESKMNRFIETLETFEGQLTALSEAL